LILSDPIALFDPDLIHSGLIHFVLIHSDPIRFVLIHSDPIRFVLIRFVLILPGLIRFVLILIVQTIQGSQRQTSLQLIGTS
jgi:hypothetical protein